MKIYYSATERGFLSDAMHTVIPADAVIISLEEHESLMGGQRHGKRIIANEKGYPVLVDPPAPTLEEAKTAKRAEIETARKAAEHEGVTIENIRYAGDPSNRQALSEALDLAAITDQTHFSSWKDSDGQFHTAHPVADVHAALLAIGQRRGELIDREGVLSEQISAANDVATVEAIQW